MTSRLDAHLPPRPCESVHLDHVMLVNKVWPNQLRRKPRKPLAWARRLPVDGIKIHWPAAAVKAFARAHEAHLRAAASERGKGGEKEP
jgi:hypothetical protein